MPSGAFEEAGNMKSPRCDLVDRPLEATMALLARPVKLRLVWMALVNTLLKHLKLLQGLVHLMPKVHHLVAGPTPTAGDDNSHTRHLSKSTTAPLQGGMGPIGSRPNTQHAANPSLNKRTTSPLPSSMSYGFGSNEQVNERSTSSNSNSNAQKESGNNPAIGTWGTGSGVWGSNKIGQTSVWG